MTHVLQDLWNVLTFRASRETLQGLGPRHLALGGACAWLAGIGRYWDHPDAELLQYLGLGSVIYVLALGTVLWLLTWPLRPADWRWLRVVAFVSLTSPPALLYAIPVERFINLSAAAAVNAWFLAIVAAWRVALLCWFFLRLGRLGIFRTIVATLLPLALIVVSLALLNLEKVVFDLMSGAHESTASANDLAYEIVVFLALMSYIAAPVLLLLYAVTAIWLQVKARRERAG